MIAKCPLSSVKQTALSHERISQIERALQLIVLAAKTGPGRFRAFTAILTLSCPSERPLFGSFERRADQFL
jgi:hypothetical protein